MEVVLAPHPVLSTAAGRADPLDPAVVRLADGLVALMRSAPGCVGVAAPQVGAGVRLFVLDVTGARGVTTCAGLVVLCDPEVLSASGREVRREGCLSVPDLTGDVARSTSLVVRGRLPGSGLERVIEAEAFEARALQHELDHLAGLLFLDRAVAVFPRVRYR